MEPITIIGYVLALIASAIALRSSIPKQTIINQKALIDTYEKRLKALEDSDTEKDKALAVLDSKVDVLQTIPLATIAEALKEIVHTQKDIITLMNKEK
jgi:hypothetical protein